MQEQIVQLRALGYSPGWASRLSPEVLRDQHTRWVSGDISDLSGLRRGAFKRLIDTGPLDQAGVLELLALLSEEPDAKVRSWSLKRLIRRPELGRWRLEVLKLHPLIRDAGLQEAVTHASLIRGLAADPAEPELIDAALQSGDAGVQEALLAAPGLPAAVLSELSASGASRAVRRAASERLGGG